MNTTTELCKIRKLTLAKEDNFDELECMKILEINQSDSANLAPDAYGDEPRRARHRLRHGAAARSTARPSGGYFFALDLPEHRAASTGFAVTTPTKVPWTFIHVAPTQTEIFDRFSRFADSGAYLAVRLEVIRESKVPVSDSTEVLAAFHETCRSLFEQTEVNRHQSSLLATLRDTLLPKLLNGEIHTNIL